MTSYLSICAVYRDEAPYLREWVEFHRLVGVERFFLYDNNSGDEHREVLAPYVDDGSVTIHDWPQWPAQIQAYDDCLKRHRDDSQVDGVHRPGRVPVLARGHAAAGAPAGVRGVSRGGGELGGVRIVGAPDQAARARARVIRAAHGRSRDQPAHQVDREPGAGAGVLPAALLHVRPGPAVDERHRPITGPPFSHTDGVSFERLRLNHYAVKSEEEFRLKLARGPADSSIPKRDRFSEAQLARMAGQYNDVEDRTIQMHLES